MTLRAMAALLAAVLLGGGAADAQAPVVNAKVERRTPSQDLGSDIRAVAVRGAAAWIGYRVPLARRSDGTLHASSMCCGRCRLEPPTDLLVLARVQDAALVALRPVPVDCDIDAAGMPLVWFDRVDPDQSVTWLRSLVTQTPATERAIWTAAIGALAHHAAASAVPALTELARTHSDREVRRQAMMRLGQSSDPRAADFLAGILLQ